MLLNYYNLRQQPFGVTPDPRFLYMSRTHSEALASLWYGLQEDRGFMALAAPPGMGKTTLLFHLLEQLRGRARTVFLFQTQCDSREFFRYLLRDLGVVPGPDLSSMHDQLNQILLEEARAGRRFVLAIDEAQDLQVSVLETIRLLSDFETSRRKLLQIIVAGQLGLVETLARPEMEQLRQRISTLACLRPFNQQEVAEYIGHRLELAGHRGASLFTEEALGMIFESSIGIPRNINNICFNALSIGYALNKKRIGREVVEEVLADRRIESLLSEEGAPKLFPLSQPACHLPAVQVPRQRPPRRSALFAVTALVTAVLALAAFGRGWWPQKANIHQPLSTKASAVIQQDPAQHVAALPATSPLPPLHNDIVTAVAPEQNLVVVEPQQTLAAISRRYLGEYSPAAVAKLRALNPRLTNPDHIEVGQQIRLPVDGGAAGAAGMAGAEVHRPPRK
jgi:general secretion pathway protein A